MTFLHSVEQTFAEHEQVDLQSVRGVDEVERRACVDRGASGFDWDVELGGRTLEERGTGFVI